MVGPVVRSQPFAQLLLNSPGGQPDRRTHQVSRIKLLGQIRGRVFRWRSRGRVIPIARQSSPPTPIHIPTPPHDQANRPIPKLPGVPPRTSLLCHSSILSRNGDCAISWEVKHRGSKCDCPACRAPRALRALMPVMRCGYSSQALLLKRLSAALALARSSADISTVGIGSPSSDASKSLAA